MKKETCIVKNAESKYMLTGQGVEMFVNQNIKNIYFN